MITGGRLVKQLLTVWTLLLSDEHIERLEALMEKFMGAIAIDRSLGNDELLDCVMPNGVEQNNWLYITMVLLPQYIGDWYLDADWKLTSMTAKTIKHPIDYLYEKYIKEE